jgi:tetratricopeptide (TPR) repeat protein
MTFQDGIDNFETNADSHDERSEVRAVSHVLRVIASEFASERPAQAEIDAALRSTAQVSNLQRLTQLRELLGDATSPSRLEDSWRETVSRDLLALGESLRARGFVTVASAVLHLIADNSCAADETRREAALRLAYCRRMLGDLDGAAERYAEVVASAGTPDTLRQRLEAELGLAKVAINRGNIPAAAPLIDAVIASARAGGETSILGKALIDRAVVAGIRRDAQSVLTSSFEALEFVEMPSDRDRIFVNMATAFRELGRAEAAIRLAHEVLSRPCDTDQRAAAMILLLHIAIDEGDRRTAAVYRRGLDRLPLIPAALAERHEAVAREAAALGDWDEALIAVGEMVRIADEHKLAELSFRGAFAAEALRAKRVPAVYQFQPTPPTSAEQTVVEIEAKLDVLCSAPPG